VGNSASPPTEGGILLLDKPAGLSSNAALQRVRRAYGGIRAGHTGTLDPLASGMLPICLGEATKVAGEILAGRKCYRFTLQLGERRSTGDAEGEVLTTMPVPTLDETALRQVLSGFLGATQQVPPMYSALKRDGQPLYKLARAGITVAREPRAIVIEELELLGREPDRLDCRVRCSKGTYVRVLGEDIAQALGTVGFLVALRREYVEPFAEDAMVALETVLAGPLPALLPADQALPHLAAVRLSVRDSISITRGQRVGPGVAAPGAVDSLLRLYDAAGRFFGLGALEPDGGLRAKRLYSTE
jgi:tRNA pseudouridine55 synthase